jgi:ATP-dependent Clp protease ATP-binding subunit ClpA
MEPVYEQTFHCGKNEIIMFQDLDRETQRNIVQEELRRYA